MECMAGRLNSTTALVPLLDALQEVMQRRSVDDGTARDLICEAHLLGNLQFVISRPDGSLEHLGPRQYLLSSDDEAFDTGIIRGVPYPVKGRRGMPGSEPCRVYVIRASLAAFLGPKARSRSPAKRTSDKALENFVAGYIATAKSPSQRGLWRAAETGLPGATRKRLFDELDRQIKALPPGRPRKTRQ
jgi:hypothetical protein